MTGGCAAPGTTTATRAVWTSPAATAREREEELGIVDLPLQPVGEMALDGERCALFRGASPASWRLGAAAAELLPLALQDLSALPPEQLHPQLAAWLGSGSELEHNC